MMPAKSEFCSDAQGGTFLENTHSTPATAPLRSRLCLVHRDPNQSPDRQDFERLGSSPPYLRQEFFHDRSVDIRQTEVAPLVAVGELGVIHTQAVQQRGVHVMDMHW